MSSGIRNKFSWERITCELPSYYKMALPYDGQARSHISFKHSPIAEEHLAIAHHKIWSEFKKFTRKCMKKIPHYQRIQNVSFGSSHGFPVARMPDNSEIITIHHLEGHPVIHFAWVVEREAHHE